MNLNPFMSLLHCLFPSMSHAYTQRQQTDSTHKTHFEIQDVNLLMFQKPKFVFVYMQYQKVKKKKKKIQTKHLQSCYCNDDVV